MLIKPISQSDSLKLISQFHSYGTLGKVQTYRLGYFEGDALKAVFCFNPPAPGAAKSVCPSAPYAVLALTRMVAVPMAERQEKKLSVVLKHVLKHVLDRTRWPVIITYSDATKGHTGKTYMFARMKKTITIKRPISEVDGRRVSIYSSGKASKNEVTGFAELTRWEHWNCGKNDVKKYLELSGWVLQRTDKTWASGNPAFKLVKQ